MNNVEIIFISSAVFLLIMFILFSLLWKALRFSSIKKQEEEKDKSKIGFVVDTFHELVSKLKEKEKELEVLRKIAEQKAEDIESYNRDILQSVPSGVVSFDKDLNIKSINLSAEKIFGIKAVNVLDKSFEIFFSKPISDLIKSRSFVERAELQYHTSAGRMIWLGLTYSPLKNNLGNEIGSILVFTDLTELKALESQAELRKRLSSLGEMSAGIAHELKNPLGVIAGYTKLLSKKIDSSQLPTVEAIAREVEVMDRIILDFLSFAKPVEINKTKINIYNLLQECLSNVVKGESNIKISLGIDKAVFMSGDEILLRQAFTNLIQNAVDAMKDGGNLDFVSTVKKEQIEISVADTGHGIPEKLKDKIFLPFYTTKEKGTGLGLAIVHKIIVLHGGSITVENLAEGTTFKLTLPAA
jgi:PAS domain S-box-containing protein